MIDLDHLFFIHCNRTGDFRTKKSRHEKKIVEYLRNCLYTYPHEVGEAFPEKR
jgi:hypothetical protein